MTVAVSAQGASQQGQRRHDKYDRLVAAAQSLPKLKVAVAHPCDAASLGAVFEAAELGLIEPILVGPQAKITAAAEALGKDLSKYAHRRRPAQPCGGGGGRRARAGPARPRR